MPIDFAKLNRERGIQKLIDLAEECMTEKGFELLLKIENRIIDIWAKPSSSSLKYHKRKDGSVPSVADHTFEMLEAAWKIIPLFVRDGEEMVSKRNDAIFMAIILHDSLKYGPDGIYKHTVSNHDFQIAELLYKQRNYLLKYFNEEEADLLVMMVRMHSGQWSLKKKERIGFNFAKYPSEVLFIHILDMLSTKSYLGAM